MGGEQVISVWVFRAWIRCTLFPGLPDYKEFTLDMMTKMDYREYTLGQGVADTEKTLRIHAEFFILTFFLLALLVVVCWYVSRSRTGDTRRGRGFMNIFLLGKTLYGRRHG